MFRGYIYKKLALSEAMESRGFPGWWGDKGIGWHAGWRERGTWPPDTSGVSDTLGWKWPVHPWGQNNIMALFNKIQSYAWKQLKVSGAPWQLTKKEWKKKEEKKGLLTGSQASGSAFLFESWVWLCLLFSVIWGLFAPFTRKAPAAKNWSELKKPFECKVQHLYITKKSLK